MITEICGTTPDAMTFRLKTSPYAAREPTPSWIRAPPESNSPMQGAPFCIAMSWILQIFCACHSEVEPPSTVKSLAKT